MDSFNAKLDGAQNIGDMEKNKKGIHVVFLNIISGTMKTYAGEDKDIIYACLDYSFHNLNELLQCYRIIEEGAENPGAASRLDLLPDLLPLADHLRDECNEKILKYKTFRGKLGVLRKYMEKIDPSLVRLKEKLEKIKKEFRARKGLEKGEVECALDFLAEEVPLVADIFCDRTDFAKRILRKKNIYRKFKGEDEYEMSDGGGKDKKPKRKRRCKERVETSAVLQMLESIAGSSAGFTLVNGNVQSGKSNLLRCISLFEILQGQTCVLIVRNFTADYKQMLNGIKIFNDRYKLYMKSRGHKIPKAVIEVLYGGRIDDETFVGAFAADPKLVIILANKIQTTRLNEFLDEHDGEVEHFSVLIDEMDIHGYPSETDVSTHEQIQILMKRATSVFGTTASAFDVIFQEDALKNDRMFSLPDPNHYRGIPNIVFKKLTEKAKSPSRVGRGGGEYDVLESDGNLRKIYYEMADKRPSWQKNYNTDQPVICLHKTTENTAYHRLLFDWFVADEKLSRAFAVVIFNGEGCRVYHRSLAGREIEVGGIKSSSSEGEKAAGVHLFRSASIQEVYQWFKDNGGTKRYRRIVTISGKMASRGINFVSSDYGWHLTKLYFLPARGTPVPELIQAMRLCGIYKDCCIPLKCYSTEETILEIKKGYNIQRDILDRARGDRAEMSTKLWVRDLTFNEGKIPKRQLTKGIKINGDLKKVGNAARDGGISFREFESRVKKNISEDVWEAKYEYLRDTEEEEPEEDPDWEEETGKYSLILEDKITAPLAMKILEESKNIIINEGKVGKNILRTWINRKLIDSGKKEFKNIDQLNGSWFNFINNKSRKVGNIKNKGLIYWKDKNSIFMRLNM